MIRIAIVGGGPKALHALTELATRCGQPMHVTVFDEAVPAGTGAAYATDQPDFLRLNVSSTIASLPGALGPFRDWAKLHAPERADEPFPPRAVIGAWLADAWDAAAATLPPTLTALREHSRIVEIAPLPGGWELRSQSGESWLADEVLLCTGHAGDHPGALRNTWDSETPLVDAVFPVSGLDEHHIPPGSRAASRGAALTFIDAALALSEGRGGRFTAGPLGLSYERSGREPLLMPTARDGLFLDSKPEPDQAVDDQVITQGRRLVQAAADVSEVLDTVRRTAADLLGASPGRLFDVTRTLARGSEPDLPVGQGRAREALQRSVDVASGRRPGGPAWALGRAWSLLYREVVLALSRLDPDPDSFAQFRAAARHLERFAFGPPPVNAAKLLALIDAGVVDTTFLDDGAGIDQLAASSDVVIDAVLPPAGVLGTIQPAVEGLVAAGIASIRPGRRGLAVDPDARCLGPDGVPVPGLSAIGRLTEDEVVGHDTLARTLHSQARRWAARIARDRPDDWCHGTPRLTARREPWMDDILADPVLCASLLDAWSSPVNLIDVSPLHRNVAELMAAADRHGVDLDVFVARKANKALAIVDACRDHGYGVDVGSENELAQVLDRGVPADRVVLSAAVKPVSLLRRACSSGVCIALDNADEARALAELRPHRQPVALRMAPDPGVVAPTRFGERPARWLELLDECAFVPGGPVSIEGVHFHLHGYSAADRVAALAEALDFADALRDRGHPVSFVDMGGGIPMSYLDDEEAWGGFWDDPLGWRGERIAKDLVYPYHQTPVRGPWLDQILASTVDDETVAAALTRRGLVLMRAGQGSPGRVWHDARPGGVAHEHLRRRPAHRAGGEPDAVPFHIAGFPRRPRAHPCARRGRDVVCSRDGLAGRRLLHRGGAAPETPTHIPERCRGRRHRGVHQYRRIPHAHPGERLAPDPVGVERRPPEPTIRPR